MRTLDEMKKYFEVLEVKSDASFSEVENSYRLLKKLYSGNDIAIAPLEEELKEEMRSDILDEIEDAYHHVVDFIRQGASPLSASSPSIEKALSSDDEIQAYVDSIDSFRGSDLTKVREMRGLEIRDLARTTNISRRYLEEIEAEDFRELTARIYLKGFITSYAEKLGLNGKRVAEDMIARFDELNAGEEEK